MDKFRLLIACEDGENIKEEVSGEGKYILGALCSVIGHMAEQCGCHYSDILLAIESKMARVIDGISEEEIENAIREADELVNAREKNTTKLS